MCEAVSLWDVVDFNPRPPCGGRQLLALDKALRSIISIHVLRVEDDHTLLRTHTLLQNFNPRPPCGGRRRGSRRRSPGYCHFNPRPPCGGRP